MAATDIAPPPAWKQGLRILIGLVGGCGAVWLALKAAGGPSAVWRALEHSDVRWLLAAVLAQSLALLLSGVRLRRLAGAASSLSLAAATALEVVMNGLGSLAPAAPAEGVAYGVRQLRRRGLDRAHAGLVLAFEQWFTYRAALNLLVIIAQRDFPVASLWPVLGASIVLMALVGTAVLATKPSNMDHLMDAWTRIRFWAPRPPPEERRRSALALHQMAMSMVGHRRDRFGFFLLSLAGHLSGVATLMLSMRAVGVVADLDIILLASESAVLATSIPLLPGGLGVVEAVVPAVLHWYGAQWDHAFAGALVARVIGTVFPAIGGAMALWLLQLADRHRSANVTPALG